MMMMMMTSTMTTATTMMTTQTTTTMTTMMTTTAMMMATMTRTLRLSIGLGVAQLFILYCRSRVSALSCLAEALGAATVHEAAIIVSWKGDKICDKQQYVGVTWGHDMMTTMTTMTMTIQCSDNVSNGNDNDDNC